jgi:hypothetical protein
LFPPVTTAILKNTCQSYLARIWSPISKVNWFVALLFFLLL